MRKINIWIIVANTVRGSMKKWAIWVGVFVAGCAPSPSPVYPLLIGSSLPGDPAPPPINAPLTGFGDLRFGMSMYDAAHLGYAAEVDNAGVYLVDFPKINGLDFMERVNFAGTPPHLSSIALTSGGDDVSASGLPACAPAQVLFNELSNKYGPEQTTVDDGLGNGYADNMYTWTFQAGRTIELHDSENYCPMIMYSEADAPQKTPGL